MVQTGKLLRNAGEKHGFAEFGQSFARVGEGVWRADAQAALRSGSDGVATK